MGHSDTEGLCQCGTENLIERSARPNDMRTFLMVSVFVDQMIYTHYRQWYERFRGERQFPKLYSHGGYGMMSASWLVYPVHGYDAQMDWEKAQTVASLLISDVVQIMNRISDDRFDEFDFFGIAEDEIRSEFPIQTRNEMLSLLRQNKSEGGDQFRLHF